jgi:hypothetical protein
MVAEITMPIRLQVGDCTPIEVGTFTYDHAEGPDAFTANLAAFLRAAADAVERPLHTEEVPDAAAHG